MTGQLRSELLKLRTTRTAAVFLVLLVAVVLLGVFAQGFSLSLFDLGTEEKQVALFESATSAMLFSAVIGLLAVTIEFRYGTIHPTLLFEPRRRVAIGAKLAASAVAGVVLGAVGAATAFGAGLAVLSERGVALALDTGQVALIVGGTIAGSALWAMLGVGIGALIRNQVGALVALIAWSSIVEAVLFAFVPSVGRYLPGEASNALAGATTEHLLSAGAGAVVLVAWAVALAVAGIARTERTDIA